MTETRAGRVLIAEDDRLLAAGVAAVLVAEGYPADTVGDGATVLARVAELRPCLLILDVMLPGRDGFAILRDLRAQGHDLPVLMLTAKSQEADKVRGFDLGADDYLTKPFGIGELLARVRALLRRRAPPIPAPTATGALRFDPATRTIAGAAARLALSTHEAALLGVLIAAAGTAVPRRRLVREVWPDAVVTDRAVDFHIANLRRKIATATGVAEPARIMTEHGRGYRFVP